jgi:hypothetical protein
LPPAPFIREAEMEVSSTLLVGMYKDALK